MNRIIKLSISVILFQISVINVKAFDYFIDGLYYNIIDAENKLVEVTFGLDTLNSYKFEKITIPSNIIIEGESHSVKKIGDRAFMGCESLLTVELLSGIKSIGNSSFACCKNLTNVLLPESIESIDIFAFAICEKLETIKLPSNLDRIPDAIFTGCTGLKTIIIPEGVSCIGQKAFFLCSNLEYISIPKTVPNLNGCATFLGCKNLKKMVVEWEKPIKVNPFFVEDIKSENCILIVPKGCVSKYKKSKGWKKFKNIKEVEN